MLFHVVGLDDNVVDLASAEGKVLQHLVHASMEVGGSVPQAEGNHRPLPKDSVGPPECRLAAVFFSDWHLVVAAPQIQLAEGCCPTHLVEDVFYPRQGVPVQGCLHVQGAIVTALSKITVVTFSVLLADHHCG